MTFAAVICAPMALHALKNGWYVLHIGFSALLLWFALQSITGEPAAFSTAAFTYALIMHIISINCVTCLLYFLDKRAARRNGWRVPERTLHAFMLIGGTLGAIVGQKLFRHKTKKKSFRTMYWLIFVIQLVVIAALMIHRAGN